MNDEEHREVFGFPDYLVTPSGQVYSLLREVYLKPSMGTNGNVSVGMLDESRTNQVRRSLAKIVASEYVDRPTGPNTSHFDTVMHMNGDRSDCRADNLCWRPRWFAIKRHREFNNPDPRFSLNEVVTNVTTGEGGSIGSFATKYGECPSRIWVSSYVYAPHNQEPTFPHGHVYRGQDR